MISQLIERIKKDKANWPRFQDSFVEIEIPPKTVFCTMERYRALPIFKKECLRQWFNKDGKYIY